MGRACLFGMMPALALRAGFGFRGGLENTPYHQDILLRVHSSLEAAPEVDISLYESFSDRDLQSLYRDFTGAPAPQPDPSTDGTAQDCDVLLFVCETGLARYLDVAGDLDGFPTLRALRRRSFVSATHHTTYPYTNRALFSLYGSLYPSSLTRSFNQQLHGLTLEGLPTVARAAGYPTAIYCPVPQDFEGDKQFVVQRDLLVDGNLHSVAERGRAIFQLQDEWLGRLVDPELRSGYVGDDCFHVPFML
jgi:hypothetical protein